MKTEEIPLELIDLTDQTYIFTFYPRFDQLEQSVRAVGFLYPIILETIVPQSKYRIVAGSQRVKVAQQAGFQQILAQVYAVAERTPLELFEMNLFENLSHRTLNPIEQAMIIDKLLNQFQLPRTTVIQKFLPVLGTGANPQLIDRYLALLPLEMPIKIALAEDILGIDLAQKLSTLRQPDRSIFFNLCLELRLGKNRQKEFLNLFHDLAQLYNCSFQEIGERINLAALNQDDSGPTPLQAERVRAALRKLRLPHLSAVETQFQSILKKLKLPREIELTPYPYFEEASFTVKFSFQSVADFKQKLKILTRVSKNPAFEELEHLT